MLQLPGSRCGSRFIIHCFNARRCSFRVVFVRSQCRMLILLSCSWGPALGVVFVRVQCRIRLLLSQPRGKRMLQLTASRCGLRFTIHCFNARRFPFRVVFVRSQCKILVFLSRPRGEQMLQLTHPGCGLHFCRSLLRCKLIFFAGLLCCICARLQVVWLLLAIQLRPGPSPSFTKSKAQVYNYSKMCPSVADSGRLQSRYVSLPFDRSFLQLKLLFVASILCCICTGPQVVCLLLATQLRPGPSPPSSKSKAQVYNYSKKGPSVADSGRLQKW